MWWKGIHIDIQELLGEGSQGRVFKALRVDRQTRLTQTVAVKILHSKTAVELWQREFESLQRVRSPYCVQVLSFERLRGNPALLLEYVDGFSVAELGRTCLLSEDDVVEILAQIQCGLRDLHDQGVTHGDLSAQNVLIDRRGRVRLLDFGLANGSGDKARVTPQFAAPERLEGSAATLASDLFSLGRLEQYLRGPGTPESADYLALRPEDRCAREIQPQRERQEQLALKLDSLWSRRQLNAAVTTQAVVSKQTAAPEPPKAGLWPIWLLCLCVFLRSDTCVRRVPHALLALRTNAWHRFVLDENPLGYAPITLELGAEANHRLSWQSAQGRGQRILKVGANHVFTLEDRDFSH